jgi:rSAM/selenodomain-associated transferase 1
MSNTRILLFAKAPVPGRAKTRLIPALGALGAARLHEQLLRDTVARLAVGLDGSMDTRLELWCAPDTAHPLFQELAATYGLELHRQSDGDLGDRLLAGCTDALRRADGAVLIGSDCPDLGPAQLAQAVLALQTPGVDAVLGPALDGGYVLLGLRRAAPGLFTEMPWGQDRVAELTRERMRLLGWCWRELPALRDVDRPEDLELLSC